MMWDVNLYLRKGITTSMKNGNTEYLFKQKHYSRYGQNISALMCNKMQNPEYHINIS